MIHPASEALAAVFRRESPAVLASLVRLSGDLDQAEDALQEALAVAVRTWSADGVPANPGGWLMTTARRRLIDHHRRESTGRDKELTAAGSGHLESTGPGEDRLALLFTCCHPALNLESRVALTLRTICGLTTEEIANAFLVSTPTMAQRLVRAKAKIKIARIPYEVPDPDQWGNRLNAVLATVYLTFNRGHDLASGQRRIDLAETALDLGRLLDLLIRDEPEIEGLLALMLLTHARHRARLRSDGAVVLLEDQDRTLWDRAMMEEGISLVARATRHGSVGQYWLQAALAAEHVGPADLADRDWATIVSLYDRLLEQTRQSPVVALNRALAIAMLGDPRSALAEIEPLGAALDQYQPFHAARAHLLRELGDEAGASDAYRRAIDLAQPGPVYDALVQTLEEIEREI